MEGLCLNFQQQKIILSPLGVKTKLKLQCACARARVKATMFLFWSPKIEKCIRPGDQNRPLSLHPNVHVSGKYSK